MADGEFKNAQRFLFQEDCSRKVWRLRREENVYCLTRKSQSWGRGMPSMHSKLRQWLHPANPILHINPLRGESAQYELFGGAWAFLIRNSSLMTEAAVFHGFETALRRWAFHGFETVDLSRL